MKAEQQIKYIKFLIQEHEKDVRHKVDASLMVTAQTLNSVDQPVDLLYNEYLQSADATNTIKNIFEFLKGE